ncbi:MAG: ATP-binding protein [Planctomycetes bacterium]|nr:ATP-binding protein [Planctomycetota bacterium]
MRIVLTGGPHAGKTTLIDALERRGERVVPEAAIAVIADLRRELGDDAATAWRRAHAAEFQERIAVKQLALEDALRLEPGERAFFDRGLFDGLAYCRLANVPAPRTVDAERARRRYDLVVLCELVLPFTDRAGTGRTSDLARAQAIETALAAVWTERGYPLLRLPSSLTVAEREALLLERIAALGPARAP